MPVGMFQHQGGAFIESFSNSSEVEHTGSNNIFRYSLSEITEISGVVDYRNTEIRSTDTELNGISDFQLGFRVNLQKVPKGILPAIGFQTRFQLPFRGEDYKIEGSAPIILLATRHNLASWSSLQMNFLTKYDGKNPIPLNKVLAKLNFFPL